VCVCVCIMSQIDSPPPFSPFHLSHLLMVSSTGLRTPFSFLYRMYINQIHINQIHCLYFLFYPSPPTSTLPLM
jgi:hypothetical protein